MIDLSNGIPNLDQQFVSDLERFSSDVREDHSKIMKLLFGNDSNPKCPYAVNRLGDYANAKSLYLRALENGNFIKSQAHKEQCDRIYSTLPDFAKWPLRKTTNHCGISQ